MIKGSFSKNKDEERCLVCRDRDHLLQPFQCTLCWFRNLKDRKPVGGDMVDDRLMVFIRRINLDLLWSRASVMVAANLSLFRKMTRAVDYLGTPPDFESPGPWPTKYEMGFTCALLMIRISQLEGNNQKGH